MGTPSSPDPNLMIGDDSEVLSIQNPRGKTLGEFSGDFFPWGAFINRGRGYFQMSILLHKPTNEMGKEESGVKISKNCPHGLWMLFCLRTENLTGSQWYRMVNLRHLKKENILGNFGDFEIPKLPFWRLNAFQNNKNFKKSPKLLIFGPKIHQNMKKMKKPNFVPKYCKLTLL